MRKYLVAFLCIAFASCTGLKGCSKTRTLGGKIIQAEEKHNTEIAAALRRNGETALESNGEFAIPKGATIYSLNKFRELRKLKEEQAIRDLKESKRLRFEGAVSNEKERIIDRGLVESVDSVIEVLADAASQPAQKTLLEAQVDLLRQVASRVEAIEKRQNELMESHYASLDKRTKAKPGISVNLDSEKIMEFQANYRYGSIKLSL